MTLEELKFNQEKLLAVDELKRLMAFYIDEYKWARLPSTCIDLPWGAYDGFKGFVRCYVLDHGYPMDAAKDYDFKAEGYGPGRMSEDGDEDDEIPGIMCVHTFSTPVIEIAEDGQTARGVWLSSGTENFGDGDHIQNELDRGFEGWAWSMYAFDFIKIDGEWKLWHYRLFGLFIMKHDECWTEVRPYDGISSMVTTEDRPPVNAPYDWTIDSVYPWNYPDPPKPYKTFADVAPGYGYLDDNGNVVESVVHNHVSTYDKRKKAE